MAANMPIATKTMPNPGDCDFVGATVTTGGTTVVVFLVTVFGGVTLPAGTVVGVMVGVIVAPDTGMVVASPGFPVTTFTILPPWS